MEALNEHVEAWLRNLAQRNVSPETLRTYRSIMRGYPSDPLAVTLAGAKEWWDSQDRLSVRTRARNLGCVRSFYKYAQRHDLRLDDPTRRLDSPELPKGAPRYITRADLDRLLETVEPDMRRAVALGAWAGLRVSEAAALDWSDVDEDAHRLHVRHGKGNKARAVGVHEVLLDAIRPRVQGNIVTASEHVFTPGSLQRKVNRAIQRAGVNATFHQLRHRFGTLTYGITGDPIAVQAAMGHASLETTRIYAAVSDDALDRVAAAAIR